MRSLYVISEGIGGPVKIGVGRTALRVKELQTGNPRPLRICAAFSVRGQPIYATERAIHQELATKRMCGEWFNLSETEAMGFLRSHFSASGAEVTEIIVDFEENKA